MTPFRLTAPAAPGTVAAVARRPAEFSMFTITTLWIPFTLVAAAGQVVRNAMQRQLTGPLGTWGATNIRFLFGFPFALVFFAVVLAATGDHLPWPTAAFWPWLLLGALAQIVGTGMMLLAMNDRSFVVTTAYLKTEAIQTAIFGFVFLGDHLTVLKVIAILIATAGVVIAALRPGAGKGFADWRPTLMGIGAAAAFALSAVGFRGAVIVVPGVSFVTAASFTLVSGLFVQTAVLTIYLLARAPEVLTKILGLWKPSVFAGFMGAFASQFWFLAFALTAAANVRTLALVEVLFAQGVAYYSFKQPLSGRELAGIALIVIGVALLIAV
jgi:drug/metabolite transporter (DMT)-like permease